MVDYFAFFFAADFLAAGFFAADFLAATFFFTGIVPSLWVPVLVNDRIIRLPLLCSSRLRPRPFRMLHPRFKPPRSASRSSDISVLGGLNLDPHVGVEANDGAKRV